MSTSGSLIITGSGGDLRINYTETDNSTTGKSSISINGIDIRFSSLTVASTMRCAFKITLHGDSSVSATSNPYQNTVYIGAANTWYPMVYNMSLSTDKTNNGRTTTYFPISIDAVYDDGGIVSNGIDTLYMSSGYGRITLIPYASYLPSTIQATSPVNLGAQCNITIKGMKSEYVHNVAYSTNQSDWITIQNITSDTTNGVTIRWDTSALTSLFTDKQKLTCYLQCTTRASSRDSTVIGTTQTSITVNATNGPVISDITVTPNNNHSDMSSVAKTVIAGWNNGNIFIQGYTKLGISLTYTLQQGTTLDRCQIYINGALVSDSKATTYSSSAPINDTGSIKISALMTDSRGNTGEAETYIDVLAYSQPIALSFSAIRFSSDRNTEDNENGTNLSAKATIMISSVNGYNSGGVKVRFKQVSDSSYQYNARSITSGASNYTQINYNNNGGVVSVSTNQSHIVQFIIYDQLHPESADPTICEIVIPTKSVVIHSRDGGNGVSLGGYNTANAIQLWLDTIMYQKLIVTSSIYGTSDPPTTGAEVGQLYFQLID